MTKILALIAGIFLIGFPAWMLKEMSVPLPEYRKGGYADYVLLAYELLAVYGSVLLGIAVHVGAANGGGRPLFLFGRLTWGSWGVRAGERERAVFVSVRPV